jgi:hypothetical protein
MLKAHAGEKGLVPYVVLAPNKNAPKKAKRKAVAKAGGGEGGAENRVELRAEFEEQGQNRQGQMADEAEDEVEDEGDDLEGAAAEDGELNDDEEEVGAVDAEEEAANEEEIDRLMEEGLAGEEQEMEEGGEMEEAEEMGEGEEIEEGKGEGEIEEEEKDVHAPSMWVQADFDWTARTGALQDSGWPLVAEGQTVEVVALSDRVVRVHSARDDSTMQVIYDALSCNVGRAAAYAFASEANPDLSGAKGSSLLKAGTMVAFPFGAPPAAARPSRKRKRTGEKGVMLVVGARTEPTDKTSDLWYSWCYDEYLADGKSEAQAEILSTQDRNRHLGKRRR